MSTEKSESQASKLASLQSWEMPHMRLFFSADIIGSTAFKQKPLQSGDESGAEKYPPWFNMVLAFYHQAEQSFTRNWRLMLLHMGIKDDVPNFCGEPPAMWKTIGDEVLFTKRIDSPIQALLCCLVWMHTLADIRALLAERGLEVKSSAWVADFPLRNQEVVLSRNTGTKKDTQNDELGEDEHPFRNQLLLEKYYSEISSKNFSDNFILDYIGPSIDTGFRLSSYATSRKFVLSLELAYILSVAQDPREKSNRSEARSVQKGIGIFKMPDIVFRYDGRVPLKGVMNGNLYPIIWIDLAPKDPLHIAEDAVTSIKKPEAEQILALAKAIIQSNNEYVDIPFFYENGAFHGEAEKGFTKLTESQIGTLLVRSEKFRTIKSQRELEMNDLAAIDNKKENTRTVFDFLQNLFSSIDAVAQNSAASKSANNGALSSPAHADSEPLGSTSPKGQVTRKTTGKRTPAKRTASSGRAADAESLAKKTSRQMVKTTKRGAKTSAKAKATPLKTAGVTAVGKTVRKS